MRVTSGFFLGENFTLPEINISASGMSTPRLAVSDAKIKTSTKIMIGIVAVTFLASNYFVARGVK